MREELRVRRAKVHRPDDVVYGSHTPVRVTISGAVLQVRDRQGRIVHERGGVEGVTTDTAVIDGKDTAVWRVVFTGESADWLVEQTTKSNCGCGK